MMTPITLQRFMRELDTIKQETDAGTLKPEDHDSRLARVISELRERGLGGSHVEGRAALADAVARGIISESVEVHLQDRLGLAG